MTRAAVAARSVGARSRRASLALLAAALLLVAWMQVTLFVHERIAPLWLVVLVPVTGLVYAAAGTLALWRRPNNRLGVIMTVGAVVWLVDGLASTDVPGLAAAGVVMATVPLAVVVHLLHAFPSGRIDSRPSRWTVGMGYAVCLVLHVPLYLFAPAASPRGLLAVADRPGLAAAGYRLQIGVGIAVMVVTAAILAARLRRAPARRRRVLAPLYLYGIVAVLAVPLVRDVVRPWLGVGAGPTQAIQIVTVALVPVAFTAAVLRGGFARTSEIQELSAWLAGTAAGRPSLVDALARALGDESVQLAFWVPAQHAYFDAEGHPVEFPRPGSGRAVVDVESGGERIGAIVYDGTLIAEPDLVRRAGRVIAIAADQQRLTAQLLASQRQLHESRVRILHAGDRERSRIAQNLHDGLQAELVLLALEAQRLAGLPGTPEPNRDAAIRLRARIDRAAAGLRDLVYAVMPAPLVERGLAAATEDLVDRLPLPASLELDLPGAIPGSVQATAYFVVAEALHNAVRHSAATKVLVRLSLLEGALSVQVDDDGVGGAQPGQGLGLRGLIDRADALGGWLRVDSPVGGGTHVLAELPCES